MKKLSLVISALFFIMAAALGWFLPVAAFNFEDKFYEGKQAALDIEQINLSYREDLAMNQKINMVKYDINISENIGLEKGVFSTKEDIERIISEFMVDFTGYKQSIPSAVLIPVNVNASMLCMPIDWATKDDPQMMAVIRSNMTPCGLVLRICFPFF